MSNQPPDSIPEHSDIQDFQSRLRANAESDLARMFLTRSIGAAKLSMEISPCCWMYQGYPLQARITLAGGGSAFAYNRSKTFETANVADLEAMLNSVKLVKCNCCDKLAFDPETIQSNRNGQCESCFLEALNKEFESAKKVEDEDLAKRDAAKKAAGFTHRAAAWVHPAEGSDYQVNIYFKGNPSKGTLIDRMKQLKSEVLDDYTIIAL